MSEINFNSIFDGVSLALHAAFPAVKVHGGNVKQGLSPGDFNVVLLSAGHTKEVGQRYKRTPVVDVIYYPAGGEADCYDKADKLTQLLGSIKTPQGDTIHAASCEWQMDGDVLHVFLRYDHSIFIVQKHDFMETLHIEQEG